MRLDSNGTGLIALSMLGALSLVFGGCANTSPDAVSNADQHITKPSDGGGQGGDKPGDSGSCTGGDKGGSSACFATKIGDGLTCVDATTLKLQAIDACTNQAAATLSSLSLSNDCADGGSTIAFIECCTEIAPPVDNSCIAQAIGDGTACIDATTIKESAIDACTAEGAVLTDLSLANDCADGGSTMAKLVCCLPAPPSGGDCKVLAVGDGASCEDPIVLKQASLDLCTQAGLVFADFALDGDCPNGQSTTAKATCCPP